MIAVTVDECGLCHSLFFPGDDIYNTKNLGDICDTCYATHTCFAGVVFT